MKAVLFLIGTILCLSCQKSPNGGGVDENVTTRGTIEVTARLLEVPEGAVFHRDLYNYATILKYEVTAVHRGDLTPGSVIFVGHYNPWKPRAQASDNMVKGIGGTVREFRGGALHRMALETPMDDHYLGGIVDKYFGRREGASLWAVWTNDAD